MGKESSIVGLLKLLKYATQARISDVADAYYSI